MNLHDSLTDAATRASERMVGALGNAACYDHPAHDIEVVETHISWVVLAGAYAYKIKKPVNLGFLDFSSPAARRYYCEEELRLNRRFAPDLYLEVVPITGDINTPHVGGAGPLIEYAVKMRRFDQAARLDAMLARGALERTVIEALARRIATFHATAPAALDTPGIEPAKGFLTPALENFRQMLPYLESAEDLESLARLRQWTLTEYERIARLQTQRLSGGSLRECHGDMHLANVVLLEGGPTPFDCIEFDPALRWIDPMSEVAFMAMDLAFHGRRDLAHVFLDTYLTASGDYGGVPLLPFYLVYRAMVRAKVSLLQGAPSAQERGAIAKFRDYVALANSYTRPARGAIVISHGLSGSGKTTLTEPLIAKFGALRLRSDIERKRMHGLSALAPASSAVGSGIYTPEATSRIYTRLYALARGIVAGGFPALVDASFLKQDQRSLFRQLASELQVPFVMISVSGSPEALRARIASRAAAGGDSSDATSAVLDHQIATQEPLSADELDDAISIATGNDIAISRRILCDALEQRLWKTT